MRFPVSSTAFYRYLDRVGLETRAFPNPLDPATPSTVIDLEGQSIYVERPEDLPPLFREVADAWREALEEGASFGAIQDAMRARDVPRLKELWNRLVPIWDDRSFYDFVATSRAFASRSFRTARCSARSVSAPAAGTPTSPTRCWRSCASSSPTATRTSAWWWAGSSSCRGGCGGGPPSGWHTGRGHHARAPARRRAPAGRRGDRTRRRRPLRDHRPLGRHARLPRGARHLPVLAAHHPHRHRRVPVPPKLWMALDRTRYMQSSKTFVMVDRPFWNERDPAHRPLPDEHDAHRPSDPRHLPVRQRPRPAGRDLPVLLLDGRRAEDAAAADRPAGRPDAGRACRRSIPASTSPGTSSATRSPSPGRPTPTSSAPSRAPCPATTATTAACTAISCRTACRRTSAASSSPATTSPGPRLGRGCRHHRRSTPSGASSHHLGGRTHPENPGPGDRFAELAPVALPD